MTEPPLIGFSYFATGAHPQGWRVPGAISRSTFDPKVIRSAAESTERGGLDFFLLGDRLVSLPASQTSRPFEVQRPEALTTAAFVAAVTRRVGIITTVNVTYSDPYNVARAVAQLDHLSDGRVALNVVTGKNAEASKNFGMDAHADAVARYQRAEEYVSVLRALWQSWSPDAPHADKETGIYISEGSINAINHVGHHFRVSGPLNVSRSPQGVIPIGHAGNSSESEQFGARNAEFRYIATHELAKGVKYYDRIKAQVREAGRNPDDQVLIAGFVPYIAETRAEAQQIYARTVDLSAPAPVSAVTEMLGIDPQALNKSKRLSDHPAVTLNEKVDRVLRDWAYATGRPEPTVAQLATFVRREKGARPLVGAAEEISRYMIERLAARTADAFVLTPPFMPQPLHAFIDLVMPRLRADGLAPKSPRAGTFRELLGTRMVASSRVEVGSSRVEVAESSGAQ